MKMKVACGWLAFLLVTVMYAPSFSSATTYNWVGGSTGYWHINSSWSPAGVPSFGDTTLVNEAGAIANLNGWYANTAGNLTITSGNEVRTTITSPNYDTTFTLGVPSGSASLTNDGIFRLADTGKNSHICASNPLSLSGSGRIILESAAKSRIYNISTYNIVNGANHTIEGVGTVDPYALVNYGMIQANGDRLLMARNFYNFPGGVLSSGPESVLQLGTWYDAYSGLNFNYDSRGGSIDLNGGTVKAELANFINADISNSAPPGGTLELNLSNHSYTSFDFKGNTTLGAGLVVNVNNGLIFTSQIGTDSPIVTNNGVINLLATGDGNSDFSSSNSTLTGSGKIVLNGNAKSRVLGGGSASASLTHGVNHTIEGGGKIANYIINNGTILANNGNLVLAGKISGTGQVQVKDGAKLIIAGGGVPPNLLTTQNLDMTQNAAIQVDWNCSVTASRFVYAMTDPSSSKWLWDSTSTLNMTGTGPENFLEVGGKTDLPDPFVNNFALPNLVISGDITLVDLYHNNAIPVQEALYVNNLTVSPGAVLNLNNLRLWCYLNGNPHQVKAGEGDLFGGGQIINRPLKPVTTSILLLLLDD